MPKVEPLELEMVDEDRARLINSGIILENRGPPARPFLITGSVADRSRAIDCLAIAMLYEAGDDARGQRAVGQVVLNRARHPAFPETICGVVFQGSERRTGCQFTFTCDGAMRRVPSAAALDRARARAWLMLTGDVAVEVGLATHYHTDWVHPVWSAEMDKIAQVDTHLFFRWQGAWGTAAAQRDRYRGGEPTMTALAALSPAHRSADAQQLALGEAAPLPDQAPSMPLPAAPAPSVDGEFQLAMMPSSAGGIQAMTALDLCGDRSFCRVVGHLDGRVDGEVVFLYVRDRRTGVEKSLWDCDTFRGTAAGQCLTGADRHWLRFDGNLQSGGSAQSVRAS